MSGREDWRYMVWLCPGWNDGNDVVHSVIADTAAELIQRLGWVAPCECEMCRWTYDDGGRKAAGYRGDAGDCVTRAIAIATEMPYQTVYDALKQYSTRERPRRGKRSSVRDGVRKPTSRKYLADLGWQWTPTMQIGSGCKVHLRASELPSGRLVVACSRHLVAVIDGVMHDTHDPSRDGTRCVYGYWSKAQ